MKQKKTYHQPATTLFRLQVPIMALTGSMNANPTVGSRENSSVWDDDDEQNE